MALTLNLTKVRRTLANLYGRVSGGGGGTGTVTEIDAGTDVTLTPNPISTTGFVSVTPNTFVRANGTQPLTANWNAGNFNITSKNSMPQFNMLEYGAVPNGVFDNTAVLTAIQADLPANGGIVIVPNGTCYVASTFTWTKPVWLVGAVPDNSQILLRNNGDGFVFTHVNGDNVILQDVKFRATGAGGTSGAMIRCASTVNFPLHVMRCGFSAHYTAISLESNWFSEIVYSRFVGANLAAGGSDVVIDNLVNEDKVAFWFMGIRS
jgi:hypothetical protein